MFRPLLSLSVLFALFFFLNANTASAQFQTFPQTDKYSISGEKIKTKSSRKNTKREGRYLDNGSKKKKVKTSRKFIVGKSCSNYNKYTSQKATHRNRTLQRKRRKLS